MKIPAIYVVIVAALLFILAGVMLAPMFPSWAGPSAIVAGFVSLLVLMGVRDRSVGR